MLSVDEQLEILCRGTVEVLPEGELRRKLEAVRAEATVGEICQVFRRVYGGYREAALI